MNIITKKCASVLNYSSEHLQTVTFYRANKSVSK